jgi:hypothetical protein
VSGALTIDLHDKPDEVVEVPVWYPLHVEIDTGRFGGDLWWPDHVDLLIPDSQSLEGVKMPLERLFPP